GGTARPRAVALAGAAARPFPHDLAVGRLHFLELVLAGGVVGVQVGVVLLALLPVGFLDGLFIGAGLDAQYAVWIGHSLCVPFLGLPGLLRAAFSSEYLHHTPA